MSTRLLFRTYLQRSETRHVGAGLVDPEGKTLGPIGWFEPRTADVTAGSGPLAAQMLLVRVEHQVTVC